MSEKIEGVDYERIVDDALYDNYVGLIAAIIAQARHDATGGHIGYASAHTPELEELWRKDAQEFLTWLCDDVPSPCATHEANGDR